MSIGKGKREPQSTSIELMDSVASDQLAGIASDGLELGLDAFLDDGILKDIPVVGTAFKILKAGASIKDAFFKQKLYTFLRALGQVSVNERLKFIKRMDVDPNYKANVGEKLLVVIDRLDDIEKARLLADALAGHIQDRYDYKAFCALASAIDRIIITYAHDFHQMYWLTNRLVPEFDDRRAQLQSCDLLRPQSGGYGGVSKELHWTTAGHRFFREILPNDTGRLRRDFISSLNNMSRQGPELSEGHSAVNLTPDGVASFVTSLTNDDFFGMTILVNQVCGPKNSWFLRRIEDEQFQRILPPNTKTVS